MAFGVVRLFAERGVKDIQVAFIKAVEMSDAGIQFVNQVLLLGF